MELKPSLVGLVPFAAMMMAEFFDVGLMTLSKAALSKGMSNFVFVVYSNALATLILLPSSFLLQRSTLFPPLLHFKFRLSPPISHSIFLLIQFLVCSQNIETSPDFFSPLQILPAKPFFVRNFTVTASIDRIKEADFV